MKLEFVTSDLHIGQAKSIEFDKRPFRDLKHMHGNILENYNKTVPVDGICYFLGDIGIDKVEIRRMLSLMNGTKILCCGNHDKSIHSLGFDAVMYGFVTYLHNQRVTFSHCPLKGVYREPTDHFENENARGGNWHGEAKNDKFTFDDHGQYHVHGHIHSGKHTTVKKTYLGRQIDIGQPAHHFRPVSFSHIESWIMKNEKQKNPN